MANRRSLQTLTHHLLKSKPYSNAPQSSFHHPKTLTLTLTQTLKPLNPDSFVSKANFVSSRFVTYRGYLGTRIDNIDKKNSEESEDEDDDESGSESDYDDDNDEIGEGNSGVKREYSGEEKEVEAAAIGYKVIGQLQRSDRVFKDYEPVFAVIQIGAHQFKVSNGDCIYTEKLKFCEVHDKIILNKVLMLGSKTQTVIGRPVLTEAAVHAVVEEHALDAKVIIFKKKRRKNYRRTKGHRQELTKLRITDIQGIQKPETPTPPKPEKAAAKKVGKAAVAA